MHTFTETVEERFLRFIREAIEAGDAACERGRSGVSTRLKDAVDRLHDARREVEADMRDKETGEYWSNPAKFGGPCA